MIPEKGTPARRFNKDDAWKAVKGSLMAMLAGLLLLVGENLVVWLNQLPKDIDFGPYAPLAYGVCGFIATAIAKFSTDTRHIEIEVSKSTRAKTSAFERQHSFRNYSILLLVLILPCLMTGGCISTTQPDELSAQVVLTPRQQLFTLQSEYNAVAAVAADYCESPKADAKIKGIIKAIDNRVDIALRSRGPAGDSAKSLKKEIENISAVLKQIWKGEERK